MNTTYLYIIIGILILWSAYGFFASRVENAEYTVVEKNKDYEIRNYSKQIVAQTTVEGSYDEALNQGFRIIAGYIFGGNTKKEPIAMTAPVIEQEPNFEKIAMTAPVVVASDKESKDIRVISFVMPREYTLKSLPVPDDSRVKLVEVPERKMAVLRFSWFRTESRVEKMKERLMEYVSIDGLKASGGPAFAGYNAPGTPPWMIRNEVMVELVD